MNRYTAVIGSVIFLCLLLAGVIFAEWEQVCPGIEYQKFTLPDPNNVYVARMDRSNTSCIIDSCIASGRLYKTGLPYSGRETVSGMANRYDDTFGYWGQEWGKYRYDVKVAINGDGFDYNTGLPTGGQIISGGYAKRIPEWFEAGFVWRIYGDCFLGKCVHHRNEKNYIKYPSGVTQNFSINKARGSNELVIYTQHWAERTYTDNSGVEVIVEMETPLRIMPPPSYSKGYVREIRNGIGSAPILFDHIVLSATGSAASTLLANVSIGSEIQISQEITHYQSDCSTPRNLDFTKTYANIGYMGCMFLEDGVVRTCSNFDRHPRTAVAYNDNYIFFVVVDGRSTVSVGMTYEELGNFCKNVLGATNGVNQDGGGSSTIWVNGVVKNSPSDGSERLVANGYLMISLQPKQTSTTFNTGDTIKIKSPTELRSGPGTNYGALASLSVNQTGTILNHSLNGIYAKSKYWWKCDFSGNVGWVAEDAIEKYNLVVPEWKLY